MDYPKASLTNEVQQLAQLVSLHGDLLHVNERTHRFIMEIQESLNKIQPAIEPKNLESSPNKPEEPSFINEMRRQLRFANENADRLSNVCRHLNTLI